MQFLKKHVPKPHTLVSLLDDRLAGFQPARSHRTIHASAVTKEGQAFCPREYALLDVTNKKPRDEFISCACRVAFDIGDDYSDRLRNEWLKDLAVGDWKCQVCGHKVSFSKYPKHSCPDCQNRKWRYEEVRYLSPTTGISGGIDLIVDMGQPKLILVEVKSMDKDQFKALKAPLSEHRARTCLYLYLVAEEGLGLQSRVETEYARILYISKGFGTKNEEEGGKIVPFKEFVIPRDDSLIPTYLEKGRAVKEFREKGGHIPNGVCTTALCKRAVECPVRAECFSPAYGPAVQFTQDPYSMKWGIKMPSKLKE